MNALFLAALSTATLLVSTASTNAAAPSSPAGHWEWQHTAQYGPRAALATSHRVWIADPAATAANGCGKMAASMSTADCMAMMGSGTASPSKS
jgi:hypothetical protein